MAMMITNPTDFEDTANSNNFVTDQFYEFVVPSRGSNEFYKVYPKNLGLTQLQSEETVQDLADTSTDQGYLQIFQANNIDNISGFKFVGQGLYELSLITELIDGFEYIDDPTVRNVWVTSAEKADDPNDLYFIELKKDDREELYGERCMKCEVGIDGTGIYFDRTYPAPLDWGNMWQVDFWVRMEAPNAGNRWKIAFIDTDGVEASGTFSGIADRVWEAHSFPKTLLDNNDIVNWSAIEKIRFYCDFTDQRYKIHLDQLEMTRNIGEINDVDVQLSLHDFGSSPDFLNLGTALTLDNNLEITTTTISSTNKKISECALTYGVVNPTQLIEGNYYGILIHTPIAGELRLYGTTTQSFLGGKSYNVLDDGSMVEQDKSLAFNLCTFSESVVKQIIITQDVHSPDSLVTVLVVDPATLKIIKLLGTFKFARSNEIVIDYDYSIPESNIINVDNHLHIFYQDSSTSNTSRIDIQARYHYNTIGKEV